MFRRDDAIDGCSAFFRLVTDHGRADRLDAEDLDFYERVRQGFLEQAASDPRRFRVVESGGDPARTAAQVRAALADLLTAGVVSV